MTTMLNKHISICTPFNMPVSMRAPLQSRGHFSPVYYAMPSSTTSRGPQLPNARPIKHMNRVLPLLSELVEIQALTAAFETIAGRSAMVGFAVALSVELLVPHSGATGLFGQFDSAGAFVFLVAGLVTCSVALAASSPVKLSRTLLEPVLASLTSKSRSACSVTGRNVDGALDSAMESVFNPAFVRQVFPIEMEFQFQSMLDSDFETESEDLSLF